jgi:NADH-quinone oxidoreductase subunit M
MLVYAVSMLASVIVADALLFLLAWEMTLLSSSILLLGWGKGDDRPRITLKYFLYSQGGSLLIMAGLAWLAQLAGSTRLDALAALGASLAPEIAYFIAGLLTLGLLVKLGVFPVHGWLPDAHTAAPMPVSIMLAGANLGLAAYGILRMVLPILPGAAAPLQLVLLLVALASQVYGAALCLATDDLKRVLAYSSVSQMGYVLFGLATLTGGGIVGSLIHLVCHGLYKSLLFIGVGLLSHSVGHQRATGLGGIGRLLPGIAVAMAVGAVGLTGWPPSGGFWGEWMILAGGLATPFHWLGYLEIVAPLMTTAYVAYYMIHLGSAQPQAQLLPVRLPAAMRLPLYALAGLALLVSLFPAPLVRWATEAAAMVGRSL